MDLFNISLHGRIFCFDRGWGGGGDISFTSYENTNMANTRIMPCYFETRMTRRRGLVLCVSDFGTRGPGSISGGRALMTNCFFFFFIFPLVVQNYFIQVIWNYINDKNYINFLIELSSTFVGVGMTLAPLQDN